MKISLHVAEPRCCEADAHLRHAKVVKFFARMARPML
jgi:hypothetical protein